MYLSLFFQVASFESTLELIFSDAFLKQLLKLFKNAFKISTEWNCELAIIVLDQSKLFEYACCDMAKILQRYQDYNGTSQSITNQDLLKMEYARKKLFSFFLHDTEDQFSENNCHILSS